jgi:hypothetical protein
MRGKVSTALVKSEHLHRRKPAAAMQFSDPGYSQKILEGIIFAKIKKSGF